MQYFKGRLLPTFSVPLIFHIDRLDSHKQGHATKNKLISSYKGNQLKVVHFFYEFPEIFNSINKTKIISVS